LSEPGSVGLKDYVESVTGEGIVWIFVFLKTSGNDFGGDYGVGKGNSGKVNEGDRKWIKRSRRILSWKFSLFMTS
jgi:hypothetical protein